MAHRLKLEIGSKSGKLTLLELICEKNKPSLARCACECGKVKITRASKFKHKRILACSHGCYQRGKPKFKLRLSPGRSCRNYVEAAYKRKAELNDLEFNLTDEQLTILFSNNCFYCDSPPSNLAKGRHSPTSFLYSGIDRKDNAIGYIWENCVSCCKMCNLAKRDEDFFVFIKWIQRAYNKLFT